VVDSPKFRLTAAATPPTDPGDGDFKASRHSSSTGSATLVVDLGSLQIMVWPALSATPWSQLELPKDPSKSVDEPVRWWKDTLDSSSSSSSSSTVWLKRWPLPHLPRQFPWEEHEQVGSNLCIVVENLAAMLQVEGCNQTEVPLVGPISCRMESSFCRLVLPSFLSVLSTTMLESWQFVERHMLNVQAELFSDFVALMLMHKHFHSCHIFYFIFFPGCFKVMSDFFCLPQGCFVWTSGTNQVTVIGN